MKRTLTFICAMLLLAFVTSAYAADTPAPPKAPGSDGRVTAQFKDVPLAEALDHILGSQRINHVLAPMPSALTITMVLQDVPLKDAMRAFAKAAGVTYQIVDGTYFIAPVVSAADEATEAQLMTQLADLYGKLMSLRKTRTEADPEVMMARGTLAEVQRQLCQLWVRTASIQTSQIEQKPAEKPISEVIQLRYLRPAEIAPIVQTTSGVRTVTTVGANRLLVVGTKPAITEAKTLIAQLDDRSAFPTPVRINLQVRVKVSGDKPIEFSTDGVGVMDSGTNLKLQVEYTKPVPHNPNAPNPSQQLVGTITPSCADGGIVSLKGDAALMYVIGGEEVVKQFDILALATPGKPVLLSSGSSTVDGKLQSFEVHATVTIEGGPTPTQKKQPAKPR